MKKFLILLLMTGFILSCKEVDIQDVLTNLTLDKKTVLADGQSTINVQVDLINDSSSDRKNVIFSTSSGVFTGSGNSKYVAKAEYDNGKLVAKAKIRAPIESGKVIVSVQPEFDSPVKEFVLTDSFEAMPSTPQTIQLEPSSFGIAPTFKNEVVLVGLLKNVDGKFVSKGTEVEFSDDLLAGGDANGRFRLVQAITGDSSKVSAIYSANTFPVGTVIKITCIIKNTSYSDSVLLTINE